MSNNTRGVSELVMYSAENMCLHTKYEDKFKVFNENILSRHYELKKYVMNNRER